MLGGKNKPVFSHRCYCVKQCYTWVDFKLILEKYEINNSIGNFYGNHRLTLRFGMAGKVFLELDKFGLGLILSLLAV